jgi:uncharacterized protein
MFRFSMKAAAWVALLVCGAGAARAQAVKELPKPTDYVSDDAHVMSQATILELDRLCGEVDHEAHAQIAVVTVNSLAGETVEQYAVDLYTAWGIGSKQSDRGVLVLVAPNERRRFIETGYGLEGILPDGLVGRIGRQIVPMLRANDFNGALTVETDDISQVIAGNAGIRLQPLTQEGAEFLQQQPPQASLAQVAGGIVFLILVVIFLVWAGGSGLLWFLLGMLFSGGGLGGGFGGGGFGGGGGSGSGFGGFGGGATGGGGAGGGW